MMMKRKWYWLYVILVIAGLMVEVLFDPLLWAVNGMRIAWLRVELPLARARWERAGLQDYQLEARGAESLRCIVAVRLVIRQGELSEVQGIPGWPSPTLEVQMDPRRTEHTGCKPEDYIVPRVMDDLADLLGTIDPAYTQLKISFDPHYGYVTYFEVNDSYRLGLLNPRVGECCRSFEFEHFEGLR